MKFQKCPTTLNFSLRLHSSLPKIIALPDDTTDQSLENKASVVFADEIFILPFWRMTFL